MMDAGTLRQRVTLDNPSPPVSDGDASAAVLWPPAGGVRLGARLPAAVEPPRIGADLERPIAKMTRLRYLPGVTLQTRVTWHDGAIDRTLWVTGISDEGSRHAALVLLCRERVA